MDQCLYFTASKPFTIGVEVEFQLLDRHSLDLAPHSPDILADIPPELKERVKPEFIQSMVEVCTSVCHDMNDVKAELTELCHSLEERAARHDCVLYAASLHPFASVEDRKLSTGDRFNAIMDDLQVAGRRLISQALHVHIGLPDGHTAIKVCNRIRNYLPIFLALTTSSPYFQGQDTGFSSYRTNIFKALPRSGVPNYIKGWDEFAELILILNQATLLDGMKELWWDVRPHPDFGTVEIRICDLPSRFEEILGIAALVQSLVATLTDDSLEFPNPYQEIINQNKWYAARYGLEGVFVKHLPGEHSTMAREAAELLDMVKPAAEDLGCEAYLAPLRKTIVNGASSATQRKLFATHQDFPAIINDIRKDFWK